MAELLGNAYGEDDPDGLSLLGVEVVVEFGLEALALLGAVVSQRDALEPVVIGLVLDYPRKLHLLACLREHQAFLVFQVSCALVSVDQGTGLT